jgi:hypothetical protein
VKRVDSCTEVVGGLAGGEPTIILNDNVFLKASDNTRGYRFRNSVEHVVGKLKPKTLSTGHRSAFPRSIVGTPLATGTDGRAGFS